MAIVNKKTYVGNLKENTLVALMMLLRELLNAVWKKQTWGIQMPIEMPRQIQQMT